MDVKDYISSGILESYVLGSASETEKKEVECLTMLYPELRDELNKLELAFEKFARDSAIEPPPDLKLRILNEIEKVQQLSAGTEGLSQVETAKVVKTAIPLWLKISVAASLALLLVMGGLWMRSEQLKNKLEQQIAGFETENTQLKNINNILSNQATKKINLGGTELSPESAASVYWNTETSEVFLKVNMLPVPEADMQYQLWAIVDSKPVDMGVFEIDKAVKNIQKMPHSVKNAMAFAITLEKRGGSPAPTLSAMYVLGNI